MIDRYAIVREDMHRLYGGSLAASEIDRILDEEIAAAEKRATIDTFLPVMVSRATSMRIEAGSRTRPEILFVSATNSGRSQLAAAITRHLAGDAVFVRAVGLHPAGKVAESVLAELRNRGVSESGVYLEPITARTVHRANVIVLLGVDDTPDVPGNRYEHWNIVDPVGKDARRVHEIADEVEIKVRHLLRTLGVALATTPVAS